MDPKVEEDKKAEIKTLDEHDWGLYPDVERLVVERVFLFLSKNTFARELSDKMMNQSSTNFIDWIDHMVVKESEIKPELLLSLGFTEVHNDAPKGMRVFRHLKSYLFPVLTSSGEETEIALKPEVIDDFLQVIASGIKAEGAPFGSLRKATISKEGSYVLSAVERRGYDGFKLKDDKDIHEYLEVLSSFFERQRYFDTDEEGMDSVEKLVENACKKIKSERVSDAFFRAERAYWQRRNRAGQAQKSRQDTLGLGWGNHDHHTYRSSRENFTRMISIFEKMGYKCREKYYAGEKAGWGAQILEHPICNIVVFTDVDLAPNETSIDFAHEKLPDKKELGTVGLWIGLHGESVLQAGMHHLEARFEFDRLKTDLEANYGVKVMAPFSYFDFLKQAFTVGDRWQVDKKRLDKLLKDGSITQAQYDTFAKEGAIGSHMENLQRDQGFKGFNKSSVTKIIMDTDPRKQHFSGA